MIFRLALDLDPLAEEAVVDDAQRCPGSRRRFLVLIAVSRVLISTRPLSSTAHSTGESCGRPSDLDVARTAR